VSVWRSVSKDCELIFEGQFIKIVGVFGDEFLKIVNLFFLEGSQFLKTIFFLKSR
jgi:hypothetical protein